MNNVSNVSSPVVPDVDTGTITTTRIALALSAFSVGIYIISANLLVIRAVMVTDVLKTRANMYVVSLACTDTVTGILELFVGTRYILEPWFNRTEFACVSIFTLSYFSVCCSGFNVCLVALDRLFYISWPLHYQRLVSETKITCAIVCTWILALMYGLGTLVFNDFATASRCILREVLSEVYRAYVGPGVFLFCCVVTIGAYSRIVRLTLKTLRAISQNRSNVGVILVAEADAGPQPTNSSQQMSSFRSSLKALKMFVLVSGCLIVCWAPYFIMEVVSVFTEVAESVYLFSLIWGFLNSGLNPLVYTYVNKDFRKAIRKMLCCCKNRQVFDFDYAYTIRGDSVVTQSYHV